MSSVALNQPAPEFQAEATGDQTVRLSDLKGRNIVIYFYPKDNTPGCTTEGQDFRDRMEAFAAEDTEIFGVSRDDRLSCTSMYQTPSPQSITRVRTRAKTP